MCPCVLSIPEAFGVGRSDSYLVVVIWKACYVRHRQKPQVQLFVTPGTNMELS